MSKSKKKTQKKPLKPKVNLMAGMPRPKPISIQSSIQILEQARQYPFLGSWVMEGWKGQGITPVVVAREQPEDMVVYGAFIVDFYCLGVKNALWKSNLPLKHFQRILPELCTEMPEPCEVSFAHELIYGAVDYARKYGFEPHHDFEKASLVLDPSETHPRKHKIEFGKDGKPLFISGPYDNGRAIVNKLMRTAGEGNFDYVVVVRDPNDL